MSKRIKLNERLANDEHKYSKVISTFTSNDTEEVDNKNIYINEINNEDDYKDIDSSENIDEDVNDSVNVNVNKIVIKKNEKKAEPKRATYYLRPETIKRIDKLSKTTGLGKSALVQKLLDEALDLVEIK